MAASRIRLERTLGPLVIDWIESNLCHGPGDVQGQPVELDDEQARFIFRAYAIDDRGKRIVRRAVFSRAKGRAKSELAAMVVCAEALGPVRFSGWGHDGRPEGRPVQSPYIPCAATEEGQADNVYAAVEFMLREGAVSATPGLDVGMTRTFTPGGGKIQPITAKASSKEGGKESFACFDETHLYVLPDLHRLHDTIRRNLAKRKAAEPWSLEVSTMYAPGENSVAEHSHRHAQAVESGAVKDPGFLFDHRQASGRFDFDDDEQLRAALVTAYGDAAEWMDLDRLIAEARDPQTDQNDFRRYFLNQPSERTAGKWITDEKWSECRTDQEIPAGAAIVVAVDGARTRDCTAVCWAWPSPDGKILLRSRVWTLRPEVAHDVLVPNRRLDNDLARDFIRDRLMVDYQAESLFYDERYFSSQADDLADDGMMVVEMHQGSPPMVEAWDTFYDAVHEGDEPSVGHNGDPVLAAHVRAAVGVKTERGWKVSKKGDQPIDALAAVVMARYGAAQAGGEILTADDLATIGW